VIEGTEFNIWIRFKDGDKEALSDIYDRYVHQLYAYGCKIHADESLVKDCVQEVFIRLIDHRDRLKITETTHLYLFKSLRNQILEELRTENRKKSVSQLIHDPTSLVASVEQSIVQREEENHQLILVERALNLLTDYQREAIFLRYSQEFGYEEIAEMLDIDVSSARTLVYRALKKVKEILSVKTNIFLSIYCCKSRL
jgi:RNA polymerase sigma factor (sigma-70 family)